MTTDTSPDLMTECVNAHDRCDGGPCPYCEPVKPLRDVSGKFVGPDSERKGTDT